MGRAPLRSRAAPALAAPALVVPALVALVLVVAGCSGADEPAAGGSPSPDETASASARTTGTPQAPVSLAPSDAILDWQPVPGPSDLSVTTDGEWTLSLDESAGSAQLTGPVPTTVPAGVRGRVSDALLGERYALVVFQDPQEQEPATAVITDLSTGSTSTIDASTPGAPTTVGGSWALDGERASYATTGPDGAYCLATADLDTSETTLVWCAPDRSGFNAAHLGESGDAILTFDDARPSCRTVVTVSSTGTTPFEGVAPCQGFEGAVTADGEVWSVVPDKDQIEAARYLARIGDEYVDLGPGTSGTLTTCGAATWFVQDPQDDGDPARLLRWADGTLTTAYASPAGRSFLAEPRCAGEVLTLSVFSEQGDQQVSARVS
ncbi:MAG: hypothetical protein LH468_12240 [Nocardioides sp.]|nr:hypothetical protein [Nocardioides sp.]